MLKAFLLLGALLIPVGLVMVFGPAALIACAVLALATVMLSMGGPESAHPSDGNTAMGGSTTFLAGL